MTARRELRREIRRQAIVDAAASVFREVGLHAATLDQIGAKVGLSKASLYYYVESKEQLVADVLETVLDDIDDRAERLTDPESNPLEQLKTRARAHVESALLSPAGPLIVANLDALVENKAAAALLRRHEEPARQLLQRASEEGFMRDIDVVCAVKLLYGALNNVPRWYQAEHGTLEEVIDWTWDIFLGGVHAKDG